LAGYHQVVELCIGRLRLQHSRLQCAGEVPKETNSEIGQRVHVAAANMQDAVVERVVNDEYLLQQIREVDPDPGVRGVGLWLARSLCRSSSGCSNVTPTQLFQTSKEQEYEDLSTNGHNRDSPAGGADLPRLRLKTHYQQSMHAQAELQRIESSAPRSKRGEHAIGANEFRQPCV
jgi:hypothetical protein